MLDEQAGRVVAQEIRGAAVGGNHAFFHQPVGLILDGRFNQPDAFVFIQPEAEFRPVAAQQRMFTAPFPEGCRCLVQLVQAVGNGVRQCLDLVVFPAFDQVGDKLIAELALGLDNRLVKAVVAQAAIVVDLKITYQSQPLHVWHQRAQAGADAVWQHGQGLTREIDSGGPIERFLFRRAVGVDHGGRIGNSD